MGLGGVGVTLQDLVQLYTGFPRLGTTKPLREIMGDQDQREPMRLMDQAAAWQVGNVLIGTPPPENGVHGKIAFKTGTSYGYRDAWSVGFDGRVTIGVWVGRPDGAPGPGLGGRTPAPFRPLSPHRKNPTGAAEAAEGRSARQQCQAAASAPAVSPRRRTDPDRRRPGAAYPVSPERVADRRRPHR